MEELQIRKKAIERYSNGEKPKQIYTSLNRSKKWFFKWLKRYQAGNSEWYKDQSKAPKSRANQIKDTERQRIISVRKRLEADVRAQIGVSAIKWELSKSGFAFPSDRTINRVLKSEGLVKKNFIRSQRS